jgi:hypothetical protein
MNTHLNLSKSRNRLNLISVSSAPYNRIAVIFILLLSFFSLMAPALAQDVKLNGAIGGVTKPVTGAIPATTVTETVSYTGTITWSGSPASFAKSTAYTATITLVPKTGYTLVGVASNAFTVSGASPVASYSSVTGLVTAVFPATDAVDKIAVTLALVGNVRNSFFTTQPQITIQNSAGSKINSTAVVTASVSGDGSIIAASTATASSGVATFANLGIDGIVGTTYTITYTVAGSTATETVTLTGTTYDGTSGNVLCSQRGYFTITNNRVIKSTTNTSQTSCVGSAVIPEGVTGFEDQAFRSKTQLTSVTIPSTVTSIGSDFGSAVFAESGLASITFAPNGSLTRIGSAAFQVTKLVTITIPDTVVYLGNYQFYGTTPLTTVVLSSKLTNLYEATFQLTPNLSSVNLPLGLASIQANTFINATSLTSYSYCGLTVSSTALNSGGLSGKTRTCVPPVISLSNSAESVAPNTPIVGYAISSTNGYGGGVVRYEISPDVSMTPGLSFSTTTGLISGTPTTVANAQSYTISAVNYGTPVSTGTFAITVTDPTPVVVYVPPTPVPYLKTLTLPKIKLIDGKVMCTPGTYNAGYTLDGVIQGSSIALFSPSSYTYNLLINGVAQTSQEVTTPSTSTSWDSQTSKPGSLLSCSVKVSANSLTNTDKSTDDSALIGSALATQKTSIDNANEIYSESFKANSKAYQKALVDNRATWRKEIDAIRSNYYDTLNRIKAKGGSKMVTDTSTALKVMIAAQKKSAADYAASKPAALAAKDSADKAALVARDVAIAKANAAYGTFIESIGYGVLIP